MIDSDEQCDDANDDPEDRCRTCSLTEQSTLEALPATSLSVGTIDGRCATARGAKTAIYNGGPAERQILSLELLGCPPSVSIDSAAELPQTVAAGARVVVGVRLAAGEAEIVSCTLRVVSDDGDLDLPVTGRVVDSPRALDRFEQHLNRKVDFLVLLDPSGSMSDERLRLQEAAPAFVAAVERHGVDFRLAVASVVEDGDVLPGQLLGQPIFITNNTASLEQAFRDRFDINMMGGIEEHIEALTVALMPPLAATVDASGCESCTPPDRCADLACRGPNWGYRRSEASFEALFVSDEDDVSAIPLPSVTAYLGALADPLAGRLSRVHALIPSEQCAEMSFTRLPELVAATGGIVGDLCAQTYTEIVTSIVDRTFGLQDTFPLSRTPAGPLSATVDGVPAAVSHNEQSNHAVFESAPADGTIIEIEYDAECP